MTCWVFFRCWNLCSGACLTHFTTMLSPVISKDVEKNPSVFLPANFSLTFLFSILLLFSLWIVVFFIIPWQMPAHKWMQTWRPCRVSKKLILECLHDSFWEKHFSYKSEAAELFERGAEGENWCIAPRTHSWLRPQVFRCVLQVIVNAFQH